MVFVVCVLHFLFYIQTGNTEETQSCKLHSTPFTELYMCARVCACVHVCACTPLQGHGMTPNHLEAV